MSRHTIYVVASDELAGTIPFEADSDAAAIERGKELVRENIPDDISINYVMREAGDTECVECVLFSKTVHSYHHDDYGVTGTEGVDGADRVAGWAFNVERTGEGGFSIVEE